MTSRFAAAAVALFASAIVHGQGTPVQQPAPSIVAGGTTTLPAGSAATVTCSSNICTFGIPTGAQGPQGLNGATGATGPAGAAGATGASGTAAIVRAGTGTTSSSGAVAIAYSAAFAATPKLTFSPKTKGVTCDVSGESASGATLTCFTATYVSLGGAPTYTAASGIIVDWHATLAN